MTIKVHFDMYHGFGNLDKAIEFEEYEKAAKLRDEIKSLKNNSSS